MKFKICLTTLAASLVLGNVAIGQPNDGDLEDGSRATIEIAEVRDGEVLLRFVGDTAKPPMVWASSDLRTWESIGSAAKTASGEFLAVDVAALGGESVRFYRAGYERVVEDTGFEKDESVRSVRESGTRSLDDGVIQTSSWRQTGSPITVDDPGNENSSRAKDEPDVPCIEVSDSTETDSTDSPGVVHGLTSSSNHSSARFVTACPKIKVVGKPVIRFP